MEVTALEPVCDIKNNYCTGIHITMGNEVVKIGVEY